MKGPLRVVEPITAEECRRVRNAHPDEPGWWTSWAFRFARSLADSGPIGPASWVLERSEIVHSDDWRPHFERNNTAFCLVEFDGDTDTKSPSVDIEWGIGGTNALLPLRTCTDDDDGRLRAFRKLAREGILPPVLLWWHAGLQCSVVLDGHVRFEAFRSTGVPIRAILLSATRPARDAEAVERHRVERAAQIDRHVADPVLKNHLLSRLYDEAASYRFVTEARVLPGGVRRWESEVAQESPEYQAAVAEFLRR